MNTPDPARVQLDIDGAAARLTLTRAARMNAIDEAMHRELRSAIAAVAGNRSIRSLTITGAGRAFSAGQDLGERAASFEAGEGPDLRASLEENYNPMIRAIAALPIPVIAAVNGIAFGAGAALAIACDLVLAARSARFQFGFVNVGLGPDSGASWSLPHIVGQLRALDLALTARPVSAEEAVAIGLASRLVEDAELLSEAGRLAAGFAGRSPGALTEIKRQIRTNPHGSLDDALARERDAQARLGRTGAYRQAVLRFAARKT